MTGTPTGGVVVASATNQDEFTLIVQALSSDANNSKIVNTATVTTTTTNTGTTASTVTTTVSSSADISVTKTGPASAIAGTNVTYTLTARCQSKVVTEFVAR